MHYVRSIVKSCITYHDNINIYSFTHAYYLFMPNTLYLYNLLKINNLTE